MLRCDDDNMRDAILTILDFIFPTKIDIKKLGKSPRANKHRMPFIFSYYSYQTPIIRLAMRRLKTQPIAYIIDHFADRLIDVANDLNLDKDMIIVPVPIHKSRRNERGYNQSELLSIAFTKKFGGRLSKDIVMRVKSGRKQSTIKARDERWKNVLGNFAAVNVERKKYLIIDDISTTGATISEIRRCLLGAGAESVIAITVAH